MGISSSSIAGSVAPAPVYSGIDKLTAIFEDADDESGSTSISSIALWKDSLSILTDGLLGLPVPDKCQVTAMHIYKETVVTPYHEMLLFEVISQSRSKYYLRVDRFVQNPNMSMFAASESKAHLVEKNNVCLAEHQVQVARQLESIVGPNFDKALSAVLEPNPTSFRRLLDLLSLLSKEEYGDYNLWDRSCYWFSSMVYRTFCMEFPQIEEVKGGAFPNLGKFARRGYGIDHLSGYLNDSGKLFDAWQASKSAWTPIASFLCKEKGKGTVKYDDTRKSFIVSTRVGFDFEIFSGSGLQGDDRPEHISKGPYSADLNGRLMNITSHGSSPIDLRFKTRDEALKLFTAMRRLMNGQSFAIQPIKLLVDRRHTSMLIAQAPSGPTYLAFSSHTLPRHPNLKLFKPLQLQSMQLDSVIPAHLESMQPLSLSWRDGRQQLVWKKEFVMQASEGHADMNAWRDYWGHHFLGDR